MYLEPPLVVPTADTRCLGAVVVSVRCEADLSRDVSMKNSSGTIFPGSTPGGVSAGGWRSLRGVGGRSSSFSFFSAADRRTCVRGWNSPAAPIGPTARLPSIFDDAPTDKQLVEAPETVRPSR